VLSKITGAILFGIFNSLIPVLIFVFYFNAFVRDWLFLSISIILLSIISTLLGLFIAVTAKEVFEAQTYSNFYRFPMIFLCGLFVPVKALPILIRPLSYILPVTYGVDALRYSINGNNNFSLPLDIITLFIFCIFLFYLSIFNIKRRWIP
jgi:ABC-2 type transport system permease protein